MFKVATSISGDQQHCYHHEASSHVKGLANSNVQSASFKMLQKALEMDLDLSQVSGSAKAPRDQGLTLQIVHEMSFTVDFFEFPAHFKSQ